MTTSRRRGRSRPAHRRRHTGVGGNLRKLAGAAALTKPLTFVTSIIVARLLGPSTLGALALAQTLVNYGSIITDAGLTELTLRDIVHDPGDLGRAISRTLAVQVLTALTVIAVLVVIAVSGLIPLGSGRLLLYASPTMLTFALGMSFGLQALGDMGTVARARVASTVVTSGATVIALLVDRRAIWVCIMAWVGLLVADAYVYRALRRGYGLRLEFVQLGELRPAVRRGVPFLSNGLLLGVLGVVDSVSIAAVGSRRDLGLYNAAWQISTTAWLSVTLLTDSAYPELVRRWKENDKFADLLRQLITLAARFGLSAACLVCFEAGPIVKLLYGNRFHGAAAVLRVNFWLFPLGYLTFLLNFALFSMGLQKALVRRRILVTIVALIGCPLAARYGGISWVAGAVVLALVVEWLLFGSLVDAASGAQSLRAAVSQAPYALAPAVVLVLLHSVFAQRNLILSVVAWGLTLIVLEAVRGFPTRRDSKTFIAR